MVVVEHIVRFAVVAVQFCMSPVSKCPWLALYVPFLVINRTGLPIRLRPYHDDKQKIKSPEHQLELQQLQSVVWSHETQPDLNASHSQRAMTLGFTRTKSSKSIRRHSDVGLALSLDESHDPMPLLLGSAASMKACELLQLSVDATTYSFLEFNEPPANAKHAKQRLKV
jgi:hypothetical protein